MKSLRRIRRDKKGINTILAALLMVVIVVVAAVMVYAWSTGLLSSLLVQNPVPKESLNYDSFSYQTTNMTVFIRNSGSVAVTLQTYYVKDSNNNQYTSSSSPAWTFGPIPPNAVNATVIKIGSACAPGCTYAGTGTGFSFTSGYSYTITVVTSRNNQFSWTLTKT
jgi:flagellin-like protein